MLPMKNLPLCTSKATFHSDIGRQFMLAGWATKDVPS